MLIRFFFYICSSSLILCDIVFCNTMHYFKYKKECCPLKISMWWEHSFARRKWFNNEIWGYVIWPYCFYSLYGKLTNLHFQHHSQAYNFHSKMISTQDELRINEKHWKSIRIHTVLNSVTASKVFFNVALFLYIWKKILSVHASRCTQGYSLVWHDTTKIHKRQPNPSRARTAKKKIQGYT